MADEVINEKRREFLRFSGQVLSGVAVGGSVVATLPATVSAQSAAVEEPAVIGYPSMPATDRPRKLAISGGPIIRRESRNRA